ncbi:MAG: type II toxin-antitoxin system prevent-host-death family antitoxin [Caldilineaceae bacterium]|nr:type II toxin-antitoxin system prevent-host-death family antitoxin [Caldilineaceae bacterium]HRJ42875.1 type II toxin-antitoxin system Phd/YefM family antitoxin [Caldilineaceae bacterium]
MTVLAEQMLNSLLAPLRRIGARQARNGFADLIGQVHYGGEAVVVERAGKPMAVVVPVEVYAAYLSEREARFQALHSALAARPAVDIPEAEVESDIEEAIAAVRAARTWESL